jgi:DNA polymerase-3 subunit delta
MKIAPREAAQFIASPDRKDVRAILFYGPNQGQIRERVNKICNWVVPDMKDAFAVTEVTPDNFSSDTSLADEMNAMNMLGGRRLVLVRYATDKMTATLKSAMADYQGDNYMVIEAGELSPRSSLRKWAESENNVAAIACYEQSGQEIASFLVQKFRENGFDPDPDIQPFLVQNFGSNRMQAETEIEKIMCYVGFPTQGTRNKISLLDVQACTGNRAEQTLDLLINAVMDGNFSHADEHYQKLLLENTNVVQILRSLQNYCSRLGFVHAHKQDGLSQNDAMKKLRPPVFFKSKPSFERHLARWNQKALDQAMNRLIKTESAAKKTGTPVKELTHRTLMAMAHQGRTGAQKSRATRQ